MKTLKIISAFIVAVIFSNLTMAQVETESDTATVDTMNTASLFSQQFDSGLGDEAFTSPIQETTIPSVSGFHIGAKYLPVFSDLDIATGRGTVTADGRVAHGFGIDFNYYFTNFFGMHLEVNNTRFEYTFNDGDRETRVNLDYINVPLLASYNTNLGRTINWNIAAGPYIGINTGAGVETTGGSTNGTTTGTATAVIHVRPADIGLAYGTGFDVGIGETQWMHIRIGYRGTAGLVELANNRAEVSEDEFNVVISRSRMMTNGAYLGVMFKL